MRRIWMMVLALGLVSLAGSAAGFGTVSNMRLTDALAAQDAEHERITRLALGCPVGGSGPFCFDPKTLDSLAGRFSKGEADFGAVGAPDRPDRLVPAPSHCDGGDFLDIPGYPRTREQGEAALVACRDLMSSRMDEAVNDAGALLGADGRLNTGELAIDCAHDPANPGPAKCKVLDAFGSVLHTAQDFYARTNWVDRPVTPAQLSSAFPPGLGMDGPAPFIALRGDTPFPAGLISGCYGAPSETAACAYTFNGVKLPRVMRRDLSKDTGRIGVIIGPGTTSRGRVNNNFERAVMAAVADTQDKWAVFRERLTSRYGTQNAALIACAISHDDPLRQCASAATPSDQRAVPPGMTVLPPPPPR